MKELPIEEKAKSYDKALKAAIVAHKDEDKHLKATLERIFPELRESEDESIRKSIIAILNNYVDNSNTFKPKMIAWLEKQGEHEDNSSKYINCLKIANKEIGNLIEENYYLKNLIMDYEKKYKEALERASNLHKDAVEMENNMTTKTCEVISPELKESEDESIIRDIRVVLESSATRIFKENGQMPVWYDRAVAWLEKQGEDTKFREYK